MADPHAGTSPDLAPLVAKLKQLQDNIGGILLGKQEVTRLALIALLAEGHLLLEDVPGVGKTLLAKALSKSLNCSFHRIQFTPDLLPGDLLGTSIFHKPSGEFVFQAGPIFAQVILADEINRATPRTQSALLEAMSEKQVSLEGQTRQLGPPFIVIATQNPYEFEGTYPLPESQLDRFSIRCEIGYPPRSVERDILTQHRDGEPVDHLKSVIEVNELLDIQMRVRKVRFSDSLSDYLLDIIDKTRVHPDISLGASTRAALGLYRAVQASALLDGRDYVIPDDVKQLVVPALAHRLISKRWSQGKRDDGAAEALREILDQTAVPS
ncbi:MoxR family ATPase [Telmatocola sphagniphila]|uniref:MoxR family ATPase n=1 Tax=Telmatocola sphagniphila TaxID=1123043 RepID=A0A8E6B565_9BACT|nr:MoxR family ATPase [Telmatocola sphagniphila]QVL31562.1 MoxR family ATPase [Telmatocola sphagniphila]